MEASYDYHLITPPSLFTPQKIRGLVVGFTWFRRQTTFRNILLTSWIVKGKIAYVKLEFFDFSDLFDDLLKMQRAGAAASRNDPCSLPRSILLHMSCGQAPRKNSLFALEKLIIGPFQRAELAAFHAISNT